jgi:hypothetical protein
VSLADPYFADRNMRAKWGFQFSSGSAKDATTPLAGFQLTMWAGLLVFPMPILLLLLLRGAYYSHLWADDPVRLRRNFATTMAACRATIILQVAYFGTAQLPAYVFAHSGDIGTYASYFIYG